jgi:hypothetical protein
MRPSWRPSLERLRHPTVQPSPVDAECTFVGRKNGFCRCRGTTGASTPTGTNSYLNFRSAGERAEITEAETANRTIEDVLASAPAHVWVYGAKGMSGNLRPSQAPVRVVRQSVNWQPGPHDMGGWRCVPAPISGGCVQYGTPTSPGSRPESLAHLVEIIVVYAKVADDHETHPRFSPRPPRAHRAPMNRGCRREARPSESGMAG